MMKTIRFITVFSLLLLAVSAVFGQTTETDKNTGQIKPILINKPVERYRIGLLDVLDIVVAKHAQLSLQGVKLDSDGKIRLPRIDKLVTAICKTENELAKEITELYKENYLRDPFVQVTVREQNSQPFSVIGAVKKPGYFVTNRRLTLLELVSYAGGPDFEYSGEKIQVARVGGVSGCSLSESGDDDVVFFTYKMSDVTTGKTNPIMQPGDIIFVEKANQVYVTGNVVKPQPIKMNESMTLTQAIAASGGILPATKKSQVRLIRQENDRKIELIVDLNAIRDKKFEDPILMANDIVDVPVDGVKSARNAIFKAFTNGIPSLFYSIP